ncbi:MAG TPA: PDZ domain-containing protein [Spongiibacteraceae bacterium]|nr:PDZ domain-containing protein [Spongiibacteraceae bacterium]
MRTMALTDLRCRAVRARVRRRLRAGLSLAGISFVLALELQAAVPAHIDMRNDAGATGAASAVRAQLYSDPAALAEAFHVTVARDGDRVVGYRLAPGADPEQFRRLGLRPGDILLRINGTPLNDPRRMMELYGMLRYARDATATVFRDGAELTLRVRLEDVK